MVDVPEHLAPEHGVAEHSIALAEVRPTGRGGNATFAFKILLRDEEVGRLEFDVGAGSDGLYGLYTRAHEQLIDALRQMLFRADAYRRAYETGQPAQGGQGRK